MSLPRCSLCAAECHPTEMEGEVCNECLAKIEEDIEEVPDPDIEESEYWP